MAAGSRCDLRPAPADADEVPCLGPDQEGQPDPDEHQAATAQPIVGAVHIPLRKLAAEAPGRLEADSAVIVYCYDSL